jgi:hypothetical protein
MREIHPKEFARKSCPVQNIWTVKNFSKRLGEKPMVDKELVSRKISQLCNYLEALKGADDITWGIRGHDPNSPEFGIVSPDSQLIS